MNSVYRRKSKCGALVVLASALLVFSCKKDKELNPLEGIGLLVPSELSVALGDSVVLKVDTLTDLEYSGKWVLNESTLSETDSVVFREFKAGTYTLEYRARTGNHSIAKAVVIDVKPKEVAATEANRMYATRLLEYRPAPGQYINKAPGNLESAEGILGKKGMVTLGAWGGCIVLGFDHRVSNTAGKEDIIIYNNASASFAEPGVVWVMEDSNGNGLPDETWYEIAGSAYDTEGYERNYSVTYTRPNPITGEVPWKDSKGNTGVVKTNSFHRQSYFPLWIKGNEYTLSGTCLPSVNINMSNPSYITSAPLAHGYADNTPGGDKIDIANAIDENGSKVNLQGIHFVKIQTGIQANMGWLGELSTEVFGVADASLVK